jgi:hypothetical protein
MLIVSVLSTLLPRLTFIRNIFLSRLCHETILTPPGTVGSDAVGIKTALSVPDASREKVGVAKTDASSVPLGAVGIQTAMNVPNIQRDTLVVGKTDAASVPLDAVQIQTAVNAPKAPMSINTADSSQVCPLPLLPPSPSCPCSVR